MGTSDLAWQRAWPVLGWGGAGGVSRQHHSRQRRRGPRVRSGLACKILQGFRSTPAPLDLSETESPLVGLGRYFVNAQGGCNDCHTNPPYAEGGNPFLGQPPVVNTEGSRAGGMAFGSCIARNITPCQDGKPAGLTWEVFLQTMRTGMDLTDDLVPPGQIPILQVMPWPVYSRMTRCDLRAIYAYLRAVSPHAGYVSAVMIVASLGERRSLCTRTWRSEAGARREEHLSSARLPCSGGGQGPRTLRRWHIICSLLPRRQGASTPRWAKRALEVATQNRETRASVLRRPIRPAPLRRRPRP